MHWTGNPGKQRQTTCPVDLEYESRIGVFVDISRVHRVLLKTHLHFTHFLKEGKGT